MSSTTINHVICEGVETTNQILKYADECRKAEVHTDVCLEAQNKSFPAHRLILSCYSPYFRAMFRTDMQEKYADTVKIESVDATSLKLLIDFIYTGKVCINKENVFNLLDTSDYLQIDEAKQFCLDSLYNLISVETCFKVLKIANSYQNDDLFNKTIRFIANHFAHSSTKDEFKCQSKEILLTILSQVNPYRVEQRFIYDAIIEWVKYKECRKDDFAELFQRLDLRKLSSSFLAETVSTETLVIENRLCLNLVEKISAIKLQEDASNILTKILCLGGWETQNKVFVVYNNDQNVYPELLQNSFGHCSLKVDDFVYCIGGELRGSPTNKVWRMKLYEANMEWEEVASMEVQRKDFSAAVYKNGIAVAGCFLESANESAELYNSSLNQWLSLPSMNKSRFNHAMVACDDCLFCLGGCDDYSCLSSVEMLSDANESWQHVERMQMPRHTFAAVNCRNTIYAIGGCNDQQLPMKSVEKYDFKSNKWIYVKEMNIERRGHSACVMQNKIYVVGGKNVNDEFVFEIECYDPISDNWSFVENTNERLFYHSIVAI